jgi:hypothetical protein
MYLSIHSKERDKRESGESGQFILLTFEWKLVGVG